RPAGPQVVPQPAELKGPRVVRIEAPEPDRIVRPRRPAASAGPDARPPVYDTPGTTKRKRGRPGEKDTTPARSRSPRRHGNASEVTERRREWRDQDVLERRERLASVTGHGLKARRSAERRRQATSTGPAARKQEVEITAPIMIKDFC